MSEVIQINKKSLARDEAGLWLVRLQEGLSEQQHSQLCEWLDADTLHQSQLLELATLWDELEVLSELAPLFEAIPGHEDIDQQSRAYIQPKRKIGRALFSSAIAASALLFAMMVLVPTESELEDRQIIPIVETTPESAINLPVALEKNAHYKTTIGQQLEVALSDGSKATLNTNSHIIVNFTPEKRIIELHRGEVHFDVFKAPDRPLAVMVAGKAVQAVGTAFSVRKSTAEGIEVAVDEGRVAVYQLNLGSAEVDHEYIDLEASLDAGDVLTFAENQQKLSRYDSEEMEDRLAWKKGMIVINDRTLDYVIDEFARYSQHKVLLADKQMGEIRVAGYFRLGDMDALLVALEQNFSIRSEYYEQDKTFVLSQS